MTGENRTKILSAVMLVIAAAAGIAVGYTTGDYIAAVWVILIVFGAYMIAFTRIRGSDDETIGPGDGTAVMAGGIVMVGLGAAGLMYSYTGEVMYTAGVLLAFLVALGMLMSFRHQRP